MKPGELLALLQDCYRDRLRLLLRHQAAAKHVVEFDFNNTYQYVIAREDTHLSWLRAAIEDRGATAPEGEQEPVLDASARSAAIMAEDARGAQAFVDAWRPRVETVTDARHKGMLRVILGETLEHKRFFEQGAAGQDDLLGRRMDAGARRGAVIDSRWVGD